jgi:hypothetical protein
MKLCGDRKLKRRKDYLPRHSLRRACKTPPVEGDVAGLPASPISRMKKKPVREVDLITRRTT